jgi:hypothetical protein
VASQWQRKEGEGQFYYFVEKKVFFLKFAAIDDIKRNRVKKNG